jgi:peroxiredoxin
MNKHFFFGAAFLLMTPGAHSQGITDTTYMIQGTVSDTSLHKVYLGYYKNYPRSLRSTSFDSARIENGRFILKGSIRYPTLAQISIKKGDNYNQQGFYLKGGGQYRVIVKKDMSDAVIKGGEDNIQPSYVRFQQSLQPNRQKLIKAYAPFRVAAKAGNGTANMDSLQRIVAETSAPFFKAEDRMIDSFIVAHPDSYISLELFQQRVTSAHNVLLIEPLFNTLSARVKASPAGKLVTADINQEKGRLNRPAPEFTQTSPDGSQVSLSAFRGKYVLIDFWASWCGPCRAENPNVLKAYKAFHDKGLEILAVSLDKSKEAWEKAIREDGLPWHQVSDLKGFENAVARQYNIQSIPQNILVNPEGKVVAWNLRGETLLEQLKTYIN